MSDLAALEILASINKLASEIKTISPSTEVTIWKQPWVGAVTGVIIGFFLNSIKDGLSKGKQINSKLKCIRAEVEDIKRNASYGIKCCVDFFNEFDEGVKHKINVQLSTDANSYCFEKFYIDVVLKLNENQRFQLVQTYKQLAHSLDMKNRYIKKASENSLTNTTKNDYLQSIIYTYASVWHSANNYLSDYSESQYNVAEIIKELGIKANFIDKMDKLKSASH